MQMKTLCLLVLMTAINHVSLTAQYTSPHCHSSCHTCNNNNNPVQCTSCYSTHPQLTYKPFHEGHTVGFCQTTTNSRAKQLIKIDKNTIIDANHPYLYQITTPQKFYFFNQTSPYINQTMSEYLYTNDFIILRNQSYDYKQRSIVFRFRNLTFNTFMIVRLKIPKMSDSLISYGFSIQINSKTYFGHASEQKLIQSLFQTKNNSYFQLKILFHWTDPIYQMFIQDITIYSVTCKAYCGSDICPSTWPYYKDQISEQCTNNCSGLVHIYEMKCVSQCPVGFYQNTQMCTKNFKWFQCPTGEKPSKRYCFRQCAAFINTQNTNSQNIGIYFQIALQVNKDYFCQFQIWNFINYLMWSANVAYEKIQIRSIESGSTIIKGDIFYQDDVKRNIGLQFLSFNLNGNSFGKMPIVSAILRQTNYPGSFPIAIVAGAVGGGVALITVGIILYCCWWRKRKQHQSVETKNEKNQGSESAKSTQSQKNIYETNPQSSQSSSKNSSSSNIIKPKKIKGNYYGDNYENDQGLNKLH